MRELRLLRCAVAPLKPDANTLYIVETGEIIFSDNNSRIQILNETGEMSIKIDDISDATAIGKSLMKSSTTAAARSAIGAGTSNLALGTTSTTAKAGNYTPPDVTTTANGLMLATDKVKLNAIQAEATKNQTDAFLLNRANHTGTQAIATITGTVPIAQIPTGTTATTVKLGNYTPSATEIVTAINAMTPEQVTTVQTKLGITV